MLQAPEGASGWVMSHPPPGLPGPRTRLAGCSPPAHTHREFDLLGPVGVLEGVISVLISQARGADGSDHHCAAVTPDGVLEKAGQFAVPVGHVRLAALRGREWVWSEVAGLDRPRLGTGSLWPSAGGKNPWSTRLYLCIGQGVEDVDEGQQRAVDVGTLPQPLPLRVGAGCPLRAS